MSRRYATIVNEQADGTGELADSQREAFRVGETELGAADIGRLDGLFPKSNIGLVGYDPLTEMKNTIDSNTLINENPDYGEGVNLNYVKDNLKRSFKLFDQVRDEGAKDKPQHGAPNVRVTPDDLKNPDGDRVFTESPRRLGGFGTEYKINDMRQGLSQRVKIGRYLSKGSPIHNNGSLSRLGKSDPSGLDYQPFDRSPDDDD